MQLPNMSACNTLRDGSSNPVPLRKKWPPWLLTVSSRWPKWSQPAVTEPWPGPWLSCDLAVTELWSYWRCRDWAVTEPWLSCDLAETELWPRRDWAVTSPSCDWAVIIGPGAVTTVVTVSSRWQFFSHGSPWTIKAGLPSSCMQLPQHYCILKRCITQDRRWSKKSQMARNTASISNRLIC